MVDGGRLYYKLTNEPNGSGELSTGLRNLKAVSDKTTLHVDYKPNVELLAFISNMLTRHLQCSQDSVS